MRMPLVSFRLEALLRLCLVIDLHDHVLYHIMSWDIQEQLAKLHGCMQAAFVSAFSLAGAKQA